MAQHMYHYALLYNTSSKHFSYLGMVIESEEMKVYKIYYKDE